MIISHTHKFIFIKSRKTAGSSIQHALAKFCGPMDVLTGAGFCQEVVQVGGKNLAHMEATSIRKKLDPNIWSQYYKFCFVRNPWDLTVSRYFWDLKKERTRESNFNDWVKACSSSRWKKDELTQYSHVNGEMAVDFVGRYEQLEDDFERICLELGVPRPELPHEKVRHVKKEHYSTYYDEDTIEIVRQNYQEAIDIFGYRFESN